jgi:hypothetical protein
MNITWSNWKKMPSPESCRQIEGPDGPGIYQVRNCISNQFIQFGIGVACRKRMKSLFPEPFGSGKRNNSGKRDYILKNWKNLEYRTAATRTREEAKRLEDEIKREKNHLFNT